MDHRDLIVIRGDSDYVCEQDYVIILANYQEEHEWNWILITEV